MDPKLRITKKMKEKITLATSTINQQQQQQQQHQPSVVEKDPTKTSIVSYLYNDIYIDNYKHRHNH